MRRIILIAVLAILLVLGLVFYFRYSWIFGEGAKSGELNFVVYKGWVWKTYEGKLVQTGLKGQGVSVQSNEFLFSVVDEKVARELMTNSGKVFNLHYVEYQGALPWRGMSVFVVDSIISMSADMGSAGQVVP
ncbi:MAG: hypothetical protein KA791_04475 [Flavobacteriales bacterium]|nr:hypothetical protein [Flavobacteriales bacterium]